MSAAPLQRTGPRHVQTHDHRHTQRIHAAGSGVAPRLIMETLGPSAIAVTVDLYNRVMPIMQRDAADRLNDLLS